MFEVILTFRVISKSMEVNRIDLRASPGTDMRGRSGTGDARRLAHHPNNNLP